ncbi:hypothetical protein [Clostridium sulfidigenes]|nr:hypothetical protein [Clostridium sulfidigenes]
MKFLKSKRNQMSVEAKLINTTIGLAKLVIINKNIPIDLKIKILKTIELMEVVMSRENSKKATFKDLIAKKIKKEEDQFKVREIYVESMDATLVFKKPKEETLLEIIDEMGVSNGDLKVSEMVPGFKKLIYLCCPMLQDVELQKEIEVVDPFDTVSKIFDLNDIMEIGEELMDFIDMGDKVEKVKN